MAVVIDDFSDGDFSGSSNPNWFITREVQQGLDQQTVIGGARDLFAMYGGELSIGSAPQNQLVYDHNRDDFEVFSMNYGVSNGSPVAALDADLTADGADHVIIRVAELFDYQQPSSGWPGASELRLSFRSGVDEGSAAWGSVGVEMPDSASPYTLAIPLQTITSSPGSASGPDWTDIDAIYVSFEGIGRSGKKRLLLDSIETGALLTGDANGDAVVDQADLAEMQRFYGVSASVAADFNRDGVVDAADYTVWRDAVDSSSATSVPEPAGLAMLLMLFGGGRLMRSESVR